MENNQIVLNLEVAEEVLTQEELAILSIIANKVQVAEMERETEDEGCGECPACQLRALIGQLIEEEEEEEPIHPLSHIIEQIAKQKGVSVENIKVVGFNSPEDIFGVPKFKSGFKF